MFSGQKIAVPAPVKLLFAYQDRTTKLNDQIILKNLVL